MFPFMMEATGTLLSKDQSPWKYWVQGVLAPAGLDVKDSRMQDILYLRGCCQRRSAGLQFRSWAEACAALCDRKVSLHRLLIWVSADLVITRKDQVRPRGPPFEVIIKMKWIDYPAGMYVSMLQKKLDVFNKPTFELPGMTLTGYQSMELLGLSRVAYGEAMRVPLVTELLDVPAQTSGRVIFEALALDPTNKQALDAVDTIMVTEDTGSGKMLALVIWKRRPDPALGWADTEDVLGPIVRRESQFDSSRFLKQLLSTAMAGGRGSMPGPSWARLKSQSKPSTEGRNPNSESQPGPPKSGWSYAAAARGESNPSRRPSERPSRMDQEDVFPC